MRELAGGYRPQLAVDAQGTLEATFDDGVSCRWPAGMSIQAAHCSCGATGVCRHRVIAALAYREQAGSGTDAVAPAAPVASVTDEMLARVVPAVLLSAARCLHDAGMSVELRRPASGEPCETARLPSATVRYWGGAALEAARCDCVRASACEHVALGLWAFRAAQAHDAAAVQLTVRLGAQGPRHAIDRAPYERLVEAVVRHGVSQGGAALAQSLSAARIAAADAAWLAYLLADVEAWSEAYGKRSALYDAAQGVALLAETDAAADRRQPARQCGQVLGVGQAGETELDRLRLMCLGARTRRDGEARRTTLVMADLDTGTRLVLFHDWQVPEARLRDEAAIRGAERLAPGRAPGGAGARPAARAAGRAPTRRQRAPGTRTQLAEQRAAAGRPTGRSSAALVRFDSVSALRTEQDAHPTPRCIPRHAARRFVVFTPDRDRASDLRRQRAMHRRGGCAMRTGEPVLLQRAHERHAAHALDAIAAASTAGSARCVTWPAC